MKYIAAFMMSLSTIALHFINRNEPVVREVLTSQRLVVTKIVPLNNKSNKTDQGFKAELRDVFKVMRYENDSTYIELDWSGMTALPSVFLSNSSLNLVQGQHPG